MTDSHSPTTAPPKPESRSPRRVLLRRDDSGQLVASNVRGVDMPIYSGDGTEGFGPVELLLAGIAGCTAIDVETMTSRRAEPESFEVEITGEKVRDEAGNRMENLEVVFRVRFPEGEAGDAARKILPDMVARSHDRLCTVSRTIRASAFKGPPRIE